MRVQLNQGVAAVRLVEDRIVQAVNRLGVRHALGVDQLALLILGHRTNKLNQRVGVGAAVFVEGQAAQVNAVDVVLCRLNRAQAQGAADVADVCNVWSNARLGHHANKHRVLEPSNHA